MNTLSLTNVTVLNASWSAQIPHFGVDKKDQCIRSHTPYIAYRDPIPDPLSHEITRVGGARAAGPAIWDPGTRLDYARASVMVP